MARQNWISICNTTNIIVITLCQYDVAGYKHVTKHQSVFMHVMVLRI